MFWVHVNGGRYLYQAAREAGRVTKKYIGAGAPAEALMARSREMQIAQAAESKARAVEDAAWTEAERLSDEFATGVTRLVRAALRGAG